MLNHQKNWMLLLVASVLSTGCAAGPEARNKEVANRVVTEILSGGNFELANDLYASDFVNHGQTRDVDLAEDQAAARGWKSAFPDMVMTADKLIAEGDLVTVLWSARGTNTGTGNGLPATGKALTRAAASRSGGSSTGGSRKSGRRSISSRSCSSSD